MDKFSNYNQPNNTPYAGGENSLWNEISNLVDKYIRPSISNDPNLVITGKAEAIANICNHIDKECAKDAVVGLKRLQQNPHSMGTLKQSIENEYLKISIK